MSTWIDWVPWLFGLFVLALTVLLVYYVADTAWVPWEYAGKGKVIDRHHEAARSWTSVGVGSIGKSTGPVIQSHYTPEKWLVVVEYQGVTFSEDVEAKDWAKMRPGESVEVYKRRGRFSGDVELGI